MAYPALQQGPTISLTAGAALTAGTRVKIDSSGDAVAAGLTEKAIGYVDHRGAASGAAVTIYTSSVQAMVLIRAHSAIAVGALLYSQAAGRVDDADGGSAVVVGYALTAAAAQDDVIVMIRTD